MQFCSPNSYFLGVQRKINKVVALVRNGPKHRPFNVANKQILSEGTYHLDPNSQELSWLILQVKCVTHQKKKEIKERKVIPIAERQLQILSDEDFNSMFEEIKTRQEIYVGQEILFKIKDKIKFLEMQKQLR